MEIDEVKERTPYRRKGKKKIYTDHCMITIKMGWRNEESEKRSKKNSSNKI